ncbi:uncharacterized protein LOC131546099 [Onychostoma macrolepis]|uniref:uncharacterized protein LOC131546099 n=1 Tax=Onychostoma macrolepis TaxID=369639 RepID=UPI002729F715|nr:uncharacterized protein LOC131546099 [Onychostoma macrolepis]XP_058641406.1 uncharacterized protein LOC131546099 [Onychostoma macrolepis]XP_058641407.1 uncharacterized protein LOC131546099 [Onychostoma macrolepis]
MKRTSVKRSKNKRKSETGKCLYKKSKVEKDPESENILPCSTPLQNKSVRDHVRKILAHTPSHLNVTASADQGSPVSAPTISQTSVKGNLTINQNFTVVLQNPSDGYPLPEDHSDVKEATYDDYQILPSHNTEQVPQKCESSHRRRHLSFKNCLEQHTLTLAEVKKDTNHLREVTVTGKILDFQPAISILQNEEGINYSHYILYDTTAKVHLSLAEKFIVTVNQWYIFKSLSICDFGKGNVLCSTELTTLESFTPSDNLQESGETVISGKVTEALLTVEYICSCGATLSFSNTKLFCIKCNKCRKSCRCENVQNRAKASVTIKQPNGTDQRVVLNDALLHSIISFKREGYCDSQQLEDHLLRAERMTIVCVDDEPRRVQIEAVEKAKDVANKSFFSRCCAM